MTTAAEKQPKTNAQYQAEYRRRVKAGQGRRFSTVLCIDIYDALNNLAAQQKTSLKATLEQIILDAAHGNAQAAFVQEAYI